MADNTVNKLNHAHNSWCNAYSKVMRQINRNYNYVGFDIRIINFNG